MPSSPAGMRPSLTVAELTFSDGTSVSFEPDDIVVLVGPNNAGKSAALREIELQLETPKEYQVTLGAKLKKVGTADDLVRALEEHSIISGDTKRDQYKGYKYSIPRDTVRALWAGGDNNQRISRFFCVRISTETRITDSNPPTSIALLRSPPQHPVHVLQADDRVELRLSGYFRRAFGEDLIVHHGGGSEVPLFVGQRPTRTPSEDRVSGSYLERLRKAAIPLAQQGDGMRSFASVILGILAIDTPSVILLDEPEAFLHPPQARLLGEFAAKEKRADGQLFIATHSADVLQGLLNADPGKLRVLRIQRRGNVNHVSELDKARTLEIARDPLLKYSSVFEGIFYQHVFICESDSDCLFYNSLLNREAIRGEQQPDVLFVHAGGKHRIRKLAVALRALDVPVSVIADIDVLNDETTFRGLLEAIGGDWRTVSDDWRSLKTAIETHKPWLNAAEVGNEIRRVIDDLPSVGEFPREKRREIEQLFRKASPWDSVKQAGKASIPAGQATLQYNRIDEACQSVGLWIVPVGEMEGFCRSIEASHGPAWAQKVLETRDLAKDEELREAREFVSAVWKKAKT